ncbi:MAG: fimbrial biosis outer rane usher protein [Polaromonas sp.]|nr:fimbrial biosis outer rane usher protein [Polaromonas sp.]
MQARSPLVDAMSSLLSVSCFSTATYSGLDCVAWPWARSPSARPPPARTFTASLSNLSASLCLACAPLGASTVVAPTPLTVSLLQNDGQTTQVRMRMPAGSEPVLSWAGTRQPAPYRLALAWQDTTVALEKPLPQVERDGGDLIQTLTFSVTPGQARLNLMINRAVQPHLRRVGDSWVLRLEPVSEALPGSAVVAALGPTPLGTRRASAGLPHSRPPPGAPTVPDSWQDTIAPALPPPDRPAITSKGNRRGAAKDQPEILLLDVSVNQQRLSGVVRAEQMPGGPLLIPVEAWLEARLNPPPGEARKLSDGAPAYAVETVAGATYRIDRQNLSMEINAPASAFVGSSPAVQGAPAAAPPRPEPGVLLNYDVSMVRSGQGAAQASGALLEAVAFGPYGNFVSSALVRDDGSQRSAERLNSFWRYDIPERLESVVIGDTVGVGGGWSRPARYGGVRWGRDFGQRPGFVTFPQITLIGEAALPSTVEVLVNNARRSSQQVQPGPFELGHIPLVTGAGEINLVVRDLLGRETLVRQSYYAAPQLLATGLSDFSLEAGRLRSGYGDDSQYGALFGAATWRQGLNSQLTGEARLELQAERRAAGLELASVLGEAAVGSLAVAASSSRTQGFSEKGRLLQLKLERNTPTVGGALQYLRTSRGFAPFGEATGPLAAARRTRDSWLATAGGLLGGSVSGGLSFVSQSRWDGERIRSMGLSLSMPLWQRTSLSVALTRRLDDDRSWRASVNASMALDDGLQTAARADIGSDGKAVASASAARNAPAGPGVGWRAEVTSAESQRARVGLQYNTSNAELAVDVASGAGSQVAARAGARGSVGWLAGVPFASRSIGQGSFAVVEVEGMPGVPIKRSHQVVATTDARGLAFIPGLLPWQKNQIDIDPTDLPLDAELGDTRLELTPYAGSGSRLKFAVRRSRQALLVLHDRDAKPVPAGARVRLLPDGHTFVAGRRGQVWLTDLPAGPLRLQVRWPAGGCDLELSPLEAQGGVPADIGPLACKKN